MSILDVPGITRSAADARYAPILDVDARTYVAACTVAPSTAFQLAVNLLITRLKAATVWGKVDALWLLCAPTEQAAYLNLKGPAYNLTKNGTITHTPGLGVRSDGSTGYLATGYVPSTATTPNWELNGASVGAFVNDPTVRAANFVFGVASGASQTVRLQARNSTSSAPVGYINDAAGTDAGTANYGKVPALFSLSRTASAVKAIFVNRRQQGAFTTASTSVPDSEVHILRSGSSYSTEQVSFAFIGYGLRAAEMRQLSDAVSEFLQTVLRPIFNWGDSLTYSQASGGGQSANPWPALIQSDLSRLSYNGGIQGETSTQISARMRADDFGRLGVTVIWAGRNNYSSPATVKADIAAMVAWLGHSRFLVMSVINGEFVTEYSGGADYATIVQLNADLAALYPSNYLDIRAALVAAYNPLIPQDVIDHGRDIVPSSLRNDNIHLTDPGYVLVKSQVESFIATKGW